jgi:hypothetical protein
VSRPGGSERMICPSACVGGSSSAWYRRPITTGDDLAHEHVLSAQLVNHLLQQSVVGLKRVALPWVVAAFVARVQVRREALRAIDAERTRKLRLGVLALNAKPQSFENAGVCIVRVAANTQIAPDNIVDMGGSVAARALGHSNFRHPRADRGEVDLFVHSAPAFSSS